MSALDRAMRKFGLASRCSLASSAAALMLLKGVKGPFLGGKPETGVVGYEGVGVGGLVLEMESSCVGGLTSLTRARATCSLYASTGVKRKVSG